MSKFLFLLILFLSSLAVFAQATVFEPLFSIPIGNGPSELEYGGTAYTAPAPHDLAVVDGKSLWVAEGGSGAIIDLRSQGRIVKKVLYPVRTKGREYVEYAERHYYSFGEGFSVSSWGLLSNYDDTMDHIVSSVDLFKQMEFLDSRPILIGDRGYFFRKDSKIVSIARDGKIFGTQDTSSSLVSKLGSTWYQSQELRSSHLSLLKSGESVILDGVYYPATGEQFQEYLKASKTREAIDPDLIQDPSEGPILGFSLIGDIYDTASSGNIRIINQEGRVVGQIDTQSVKPWLNGNQDREYMGVYYSVHPNGDVYATYALKDDREYFFRATRNWGVDFVKLAKDGSTMAETKQRKALVQGLSSSELRILRNSFFALQGYDFQSWDLKSYFNGYDWYQPKPGVRADPATLNPDQARLFDLVIAEEARRK